jgi:hypothetical protein
MEEIEKKKITRKEHLHESRKKLHASGTFSKAFRRRTKKTFS